MKSAIKQFSVIVALTILVLSSCTIQKRHYSSGYYVDWNHPRQSDKKALSAGEERKLKIVETEKFISDANPIEDSPNEAYSEVTNPEIPCIIEIKETSAPAKLTKVDKHPESKIKFTTGILQIQKKLNRIPKKNIWDEDGKPVPKRTQTLASVGFICSLVGMIFPPLLLIGLILSTIGLIKIVNNPDKFKGMGLAIAGMSIGLVFILLYTTLILISAGVIIIL